MNQLEQIMWLINGVRYSEKQQQMIQKNSLPVLLLHHDSSVLSGQQFSMHGQDMIQKPSQFI